MQKKGTKRVQWRIWLWTGAGLLFCCVFLYSVLPNLVTRVARRGVMWRGPDAAEVALTFDDGPDPRYTPRVLDGLRAAGIRATFFVLADKALRHPDLIQRMMQDGHQVEVHGFTHALVPCLGPLASARQAAGAADALAARFNLRPRFYRPTWGLCNAASLVWARRRRLRVVTWSVMVGDWRGVPADELAARVLRRLHPGAVIVLHDSDETLGARRGAPEQVIRMLPQLAARVRAQGYRFVRLDDWEPDGAREGGGEP
ncbi:hypothetical protein GCM10010885_18820 [Alicyclobacillus cellulosilyticus]|uniref:NodB homology domain-containing protein n=1 Tax=Alicyclobacillus cellulosilyticus TaxID=1003997 RepID=A0A917KHB0_9BACL|nr:polysaccharide deacetylase family protein [Alicyclobacillus cellulosilyticus]GGJ09924.1 hypothetical protein GCM10010885_18820 [Alicyclobacillus cellulosilyticus]